MSPLPDEIEALFSGEQPTLLIKTLLDFVEDARKTVYATYCRMEKVEQKLSRMEVELAQVHRKFEDLRSELASMPIHTALDYGSKSVVGCEAVRLAVERSLVRTSDRDRYGEIFKRITST